MCRNLALRQPRLRRQLAKAQEARRLNTVWCSLDPGGAFRPCTVRVRVFSISHGLRPPPCRWIVLAELYFSVGSALAALRVLRSFVVVLELSSAARACFGKHLDPDNMCRCTVHSHGVDPHSEHYGSANTSHSTDAVLEQVDVANSGTRRRNLTLPFSRHFDSLNFSTIQHFLDPRTCLSTTLRTS